VAAYMGVHKESVMFGGPNEDSKKYVGDFIRYCVVNRVTVTEYNEAVINSGYLSLKINPLDTFTVKEEYKKWFHSSRVNQYQSNWFEYSPWKMGPDEIKSLSKEIAKDWVKICRDLGINIGTIKKRAQKKNQENLALEFIYFLKGVCFSFEKFIHCLTHNGWSKKKLIRYGLI
jgi:hypothetical protein